ncbi:NapC/NirT family cytochrome c [bacterium]|nr:NapC/NirT family cytochrome c [bacterium]
MLNEGPQTDATAEVPEEAPAKISADVSADTPADALADVSAVAFADAPAENKSGLLPRWLQLTVAAILLTAVVFGLWVRFSLNVAAIDGTEECGACHIMKPYVHSLKVSGHAGEATCDDCHVPHQSAAKAYAYKAQAGINNVSRQRQLQAAGELETFVPKAKPETLSIVVDNCYRCHGEIDASLNYGVMGAELKKRGMPRPEGAELPANAGDDGEAAAVNCLECHSGLVHDSHYRRPEESKLPLNEKP